MRLIVIRGKGRVGGQVQYIYKTVDQYVFASPTVIRCETSN